MVNVTNKSPGPRILNVGKKKAKIGEEEVTQNISQVTLLPGETRDLDLHDQEHPVVKGMIDSGELVIGGASDEKQQQDNDFGKMTDDQLRKLIEDRQGGRLQGKVNRDALIEKVKNLYGA